MSKYSVSPLGVVFGVLMVLAVLASVLGDHTLQAVGFVVLVIGVLTIAANALVWLKPSSRALPTYFNLRGRAAGRTPMATQAEYIDHAPEASPEAWERMRQGYADKERGEGDWSDR